MAEAPLIRRLISQERQQEDVIEHVPSCFSPSQDILSSPIVEQLLIGYSRKSTIFDRFEQVLQWGLKDFTWLEEFSKKISHVLLLTIKKSLQLQNSEEPNLSVYDGMVGHSDNYPQLESELFVTRIEGSFGVLGSLFGESLGLPDRNQLNPYPMYRQMTLVLSFMPFWRIWLILNLSRKKLAL